MEDMKLPFTGEAPELGEVEGLAPYHRAYTRTQVGFLLPCHA